MVNGRTLHDGTAQLPHRHRWHQQNLASRRVCQRRRHAAELDGKVLRWWGGIANAHGNPHSSSIRNAYCNGDGNSHSYSNTDSYSYSDSYAYADSYANCHGNWYAYTDGYANCHGNCYAYTDGYAYGDSNSYSHAHCNANCNSHSNSNSNTNTYSYTTTTYANRNS